MRWTTTLRTGRRTSAAGSCDPAEAGRPSEATNEVLVQVADTGSGQGKAAAFAGCACAFETTTRALGLNTTQGLPEARGIAESSTCATVGTPDIRQSQMWVATARSASCSTPQRAPGVPDLRARVRLHLGDLHTAAGRSGRREGVESVVRGGRHRQVEDDLVGLGHDASGDRCVRERPDELAVDEAFDPDAGCPLDPIDVVPGRHVEAEVGEGLTNGVRLSGGEVGRAEGDWFTGPPPSVRPPWRKSSSLKGPRTDGRTTCSATSPLSCRAP